MNFQNKHVGPDLSRVNTCTQMHCNGVCTSKLLIDQAHIVFKARGILSDHKYSHIFVHRHKDHIDIMVKRCPSFKMSI